jgi:hypothetical protein
MLPYFDPVFYYSWFLYDRTDCKAKRVDAKRDNPALDSTIFKGSQKYIEGAATLNLRR